MRKDNELHSELLTRALADGWRELPWKPEVKKLLREAPWSGEAIADDGDSEIWDMINELRSPPSAWRVRVEGPERGWNHPVLALEFLEIEAPGSVSDAKLDGYETLWWRLDATEYFHLRVLRMNMYGIVTPLMSE